MLEMFAVITPGIVIVVMAFFNWKDFVAKYGPPPPGHHRGTAIVFLVASTIYGLLAWQAPDVLYFIIIATVLIVFLDTFLVVLPFFPLIRRRKKGGWSRRQQLNDGVLLASVFVFPIAFLLSM